MVGVFRERNEHLGPSVPIRKEQCSRQRMMSAMSEPFHAHSLGPGPDPIKVAAGWPASRPLAALLSARGGSELARWSIIAAPSGIERVKQPETAGDGSIREILDRMVPRGGSGTPSSDPDAPPFRGGRLVVMNYELGRALEPRARHPRADRSDAEPIVTILDCPNALVHDRVRNHWWVVGAPSGTEELAELLKQQPDAPSASFQCARLETTPDDRAYGEMVRRTIDYVHAGDVFQANITRDFISAIDTPTTRSRRAFATDLLAESGAWFGAIIELDDEEGEQTVVSLSPELFLSVDPAEGLIRTRPIKGTLPAGADPEDLEKSEKDAAELAMIVDLMRNDLGRVCETGSVKVTKPRTIETHPGVIHGVAEIVGRLPDSVGFGELMAATFPPGSITGAPKIRAMQIIEELEALPRRVYCGALGFVSDCGRMELDVSIRTLDISATDVRPGYSHELRYGAGCGIVADSTVEGEIAESHAKAALLGRFLGAHQKPSADARSAGLIRTRT